MAKKTPSKAKLKLATNADAPAPARKTRAKKEPAQGAGVGSSSDKSEWEYYSRFTGQVYKDQITRWCNDKEAKIIIANYADSGVGLRPKGSPAVADATEEMIQRKSKSWTPTAAPGALLMDSPKRKEA